MIPIFSYAFVSTKWDSTGLSECIMDDGSISDWRNGDEAAGDQK
jgi:hypothetical protein